MNAIDATNRSSLQPHRGALRVGATLGLLVLFGSMLFAQNGVEEGPLSIQRLVLPPQRIAKELEKVKNGTLVMMPLADFDARVDRAEKARHARAEKARLTRTHYSAELVDRSLTSGSGQWTVQYAGAGPTLLPIDSLNLALANMRWEQGSSAEVAEFDGKALGLLVPSADRTACMFDWSARGTLTNEGLIFNLSVPACPLTTFELKVPVDYWLSAPKAGVIVTGPHDAGSAKHRLWKLQVTGASDLEIHLRKIAEGTGPTPTLFARVHSVQQVAPDRVLADYEYQIDVLQGSLRDLVLQGDGILDPIDVTTKAGSVVKSWQWQVTPGQKVPKGKDIPARGTLTVQFQQPVQGKIQGLRVRCQAPRPTGPVWVSPDLRVNNALVRGETVNVQLHPNLPTGVWDSGSFQLTNLATEGDGTQTLGLADTVFSPAQSRRPTLAWPNASVDIATTETYRWQVAPHQADLFAHIQFAPVQGSTFELPIKLLNAAGYQAESLEVQPPELLRGWEPRGQYLVVELNQPLTPGKKVQVKLHLHARLPASFGASRILACPELQPTEGARREGTLTVTVDPSLQGQMLATTAPLAPESAADNGLPTWTMSFRGKKYGATLRAAPQPIRVQMRGKHLVGLSEIDAGVRYHWDVEPIFGAPQYLDFRMPPGLTPGWRVKTDEGSPKFHHWERLPLEESLPHLLRLGGRDGMSEAVLASVLPTGTYWRFHLDEPLTKKMGFTLDANAPPGLFDQDRQRMSLCLPRADAWQILAGAVAANALPASQGPKTWTVPLMTPVQSDSATQEVTVESSRETIDGVTLVGPLRSRPSVASKAQLQLEQYPGPGHERSSELLIATRSEKQSVTRTERCDDASVTTCLRKDGNIWQRIVFRLWHWHDRNATLQFPPGTTVVAIKLNQTWLERLDVQERIQGVRLTVPFDQNVDVVRYEILVRSQPPTLLPGLTRMSVPTVEWPAAPLDVQHRVCLENGWLPVDQDAVSAVGVPACCADKSELGRLAKRMWNFGRGWLPIGADADQLEQLEKQKQTVLLAEAQLRLAVAGKPIRLGDAITQLTMKHLKDGAPLIVDQVALRALGLTPMTPLPGAAMTPQARPFWEGLGLVYEPCPSGAVLTTPQRLRSLGIDGPGRSDELDPAIKEAILHGRDRSGGFLLSVAWLRTPAEAGHGFFDEPTHSIGSHDPVPATEWEVDAQNQGFYVYDPLAGKVASILLMVVTALALVRLQRHTSPATAFRVHVLVLTAAILGLIWWPTSMREYLVLPVLGITAVSLIFCLLRMARSQDAHPIGGSTIVKPVAKSMGLALLFLCFTWGALAQPAPQRAQSVYIVEGKTPMVLGSPDLMAKLDDAAKPSAALSRGAVLLRAKYTGRVKDATARFDVEYRIQCNEDDNLIIPLAGVQLHEGAFLDGVPVFPAAHEAGYALPIKGQGVHHLRLAFSVRVVGNGDYLDLKFSAPRLVQTTMQVDWVGGAQGLHCLHCRGEEKRSVDGRQAVTEWRAQLGAEKLVHLRWNNTTTQPASKLIKVKESHFWDLRPASESLATVLQYSVGAGTMSQFNVVLPEGLFVRAVEATAQTQPLAAPQPLLIKQWRVVGNAGQRRLTVDLSQPSAGAVSLHLDIVPQLPLLERKLLLRLPAPLQVESVAGLLGYRLDADENPSAQNITVQSVTPEEFDALWPKKSGGAPLPTVASRAYRFQRKSQQAGLELERRGDAHQVQFHLQWKIETRHADLTGKFTFKSAFEDLMLLELVVDPGLILSDVVGPDVKCWHQQDALLQVWLKQPRRQTTFDVLGWHALSAKAPAKAVPLPRIVPRGGQVVKADIELRPAAGVRIAEEGARSLKAPYQATAAVNLPQQLVRAESLTRIQGTPQGVELRHTFQVPTNRGELPILKLHGKGWNGNLPAIDAPGGIVRQLKQKDARDAAWSIQYPPGQAQHVMIHVHGRLDADKQGLVAVPMLELEGVTLRHAWVAWKDIELTDANKKLADKNNVRAKMPTAWQREAAGFSAAESTRPLRAALPKTQTPTSVRILSSTETIRRTEGHWLHEVTFWVYTPEAGELRVRFPAPLVSFSAVANERLLLTGKPSDKEVLLPLPASPQPRVLELRWKYDVASESPRGPKLDAVKVVDQDLLSIPLRVLWIPRGMRSDEARPTPSLFEQLLQEAGTHSQITSVLAEEAQRSPLTKKRIALQQEQFVAATVQADYSAKLIKHALPNYDVSALIDRLKDLRRKNAEQGKERRYDVPSSGLTKSKLLESEVMPRTDSAPLGTPILLPPAASSLTLQSLADRWSSEQHTRSELVLLGAVAVVLLSLFRRSFAIAGTVAPELVTIAAVIAMLLFGISVIGVSVVGLAIFVRLARIAAALRKRMAQNDPGSTVAPVVPPADAHS